MPNNSQRTGEWFQAFYERNYKLVYRLCFTYMKNQADAEDCTEDVFVKVLTGDISFHDETHEKKWLTVTAINLCKDRLKHWWRKQVMPIDEASEIPDENAAPIDETLEVVKSLPDRYKDSYLIDAFTSYNQKQFAANMEALTKLSESLKAAGIPMQVMLVPTAAQILSDKLPAYAPSLDQKALLDFAKAQGLDTVNVFDILSEHKDEYIYYKTDHHFTSLGAYYCYAAWMQARGKTAQPLSAWQSQELCNNFRGTTYNKVNDPFAPYDAITAYYKTLTHTVNYNGGNYVTDSIYERKYLSGKDQYATFLNSNQATTVVSGSGEGKLLILKDSYANCFSQFAIDDYAETHLIDLRFFQGSVTDYIQENGITQVLVLYNIPNFAQDTAIAKTVR